VRTLLRHGCFALSHVLGIFRRVTRANLGIYLFERLTIQSLPIWKNSRRLNQKRRGSLMRVGSKIPVNFPMSVIITWQQSGLTSPGVLSPLENWLEQVSPNYGPRAKSGPPNHFIWPAKTY